MIVETKTLHIRVLKDCVVRRITKFSSRVVGHKSIVGGTDVHTQPHAYTGDRSDPAVASMCVTHCSLFARSSNFAGHDRASIT